MGIRSTGIVSTIPINNENGLTLPWSTTVGPNVSAPNHQHIFSLRIDPAIDGFRNTVVYEDSVPLPESTHRNRIADLFGVGYVAETTVLEKSGHAETDVERARMFKIRNDSVINPLSRAPVAYKIQTIASPKMLMSPSSFNPRRAQFSRHPVWVTRYRDGELYAAGEFTNQSHASESVEKWAARADAASGIPST